MRIFVVVILSILCIKSGIEYIISKEQKYKEQITLAKKNVTFAEQQAAKAKAEFEQIKQTILKRLEKEKQLLEDSHYKKIDTTEQIKRLTEIISIGANNQTVELAKIIEELVESESISEVKKLEISIKLHQIRYWNFISPKPESTQPQEITN